MTESAGAAVDAPAVLSQVLDVVRALAAEAVGERAARAVQPQASLEREVGLGSLERVELMLRLEDAFGRRLPESCLSLDTPQALSRAVLEADGAAPEEHARLAAEEPSAAALPRVGSLQESLWRRAQMGPRRAHAWLREEGVPSRTVAYGELWDQASAVAAGLRERGVAAGDTVALMLPTGFDFLRAFLGILAARAVAVPIYPPVRLDRLEEYARRQAAILRDAGAGVLITIDRARPVASLLRAEVPALRQVVTAAELAASPASARAPAGRREDPALIQYTSGSTGAPKGVLLSQGNLLANIDAIAAGVQLRPGDVGASWLPLYHDMGLIGTWLFCLHYGLPLDLQSPLSFLARPERWLWAIHERQATLTAAPNFAYELCASRVPERALEGLDLSSWRCALNGAEPVSPDTLERFTRRFARYGFRPEAMLPVYGMAECSVALCFPPTARAPRVSRVDRARFEAEHVAVPSEGRDAVRFVSVGTALPEHQVRIVDDDNRDVAAGRVGRLAFRGPSMTSGYYGRPDATAAITLPGGWLDSGDLAFELDGEVHIAGRVKDLIIKAGRNLVPQEIEELAAAVPGVRRGCVVAFGLPDPATGTERLVVVAETRETAPAERDRIAAAVTERLSEELGLPPDVVAMVAPGVVLKTSSGKIRRAETRQLYADGALGRTARTSRWRRARLVASAAWAEARTRIVAGARVAYAVYVGAVLALLFATLWPLAMLLPGRRGPSLVARFASRLLLRVIGIRLRAGDLAQLEAVGRCVLAANHTSYVDVPVLLAVLPPDTLYVAKEEMLAWPLVGPFLRKTGHLTVDRFDTQRSLADSAKATGAAASASVLFFPEGTFAYSAGLRPFRLGAFQTAAEAGVPVVPVAIRGSRRILRDGVFRPRPGRIDVWIGEPVHPAGTAWRDVVALRDTVADAVAAHCGEPRLDVAARIPVPEGRA
jgi:1-acyl-sn-glycerol-3-phosphate acyltransferase